jgi:hypothetical protein
MHAVLRISVRVAPSPFSSESPNARRYAAKLRVFSVPAIWVPRYFTARRRAGSQFELNAHKDAIAFLTDDDFNMYLGTLLQALELGCYRAGSNGCNREISARGGIPRHCILG